uniref:MOSC domain-containing protein n=1 Tax=Plectus sambesii TaxID=2011161 RepID=A0A914UUE0_9BILA
MRVDNWTLSATGLAFDRNWMVTSKDGIGLLQKRCARLCFIEALVDREAQTLSLSAPELLVSSVQVPLCSSDLLSDQQRVCSDRVSTADCGDAVAAWLESAIEESGCRLRRQTDEIERSSRRNPGDRVSLVNEAQYLLINRASVRVLSEIVGIGEDELVGRFRPNFVVDGLEPFAEEACNSIQIASLSFKVVGLCTRCQMICIDQSTGQKDTGLLTALRDSRQGRKLTFGVYLSLSCEEDAAISVATDGLAQGVMFSVGDKRAAFKIECSDTPPHVRLCPTY